ncbi:MAG: Ig-like domain-containing protein [Candidatus Marinimicrobia bacterium]|nr:Ig-like domain-containing protein [Candidatus Neomarinimicrobiota bacterium]
MKTLLNFNKIFILGLIIILSCTEDNPISPTVDFDYTIILTPASENETYYADGCSSCTDYNPITFIATLESGNESVAEKTINFSYNSDSFNHATSPFSSDGPTTQSNGKAQVTYDDRGFSGDVTISASFTESIGFSDSTITATFEVNLEPYYLKVNAVSMYVTSSGITAGDLNSNTSISFFVTDENNIGLPNVPVLFSKNSSVGTFYSNTNASNAEQARTDAQGVAVVNFTIADASVSDESIIISAVVNDSNIEGPTNFTSNTEITIVPLDIPQFSLSLDRISEGEAITVDGETSNLFYSDLDAKSIIYQATLRDGDNAVQGRNINFSYTNMEGSAITNAYFSTVDLSTQSNGTFKTDYNDGGENGSVIITANFSDTQYSVSISKSDTLTITPYYEAVATVSGWTDDPEIISGIDAATTESTRIWTQVLDVNGLPLKNVQIVFGVNESADNTQPNIGSFITDFISYTDAAGKAYVDYEAFPNTPGGTLTVTIAIVGDPDLDNENNKEIAVTVNEPKFDYCLLLESAGSCSDISYTTEVACSGANEIWSEINYSDLNNTTTLFESTLLNVFCADGISSADCCADPLVVADGDPVANQNLQIDFTNSEHAVPLGEIQLIDPLTDSNGKMKFEYLDNGETGVINVAVSYTDVFGNSPDNATNAFTVYPVEQLVQTVYLTSNPSDFVIISDTTIVYETVFTTLISDNNGASVPNVNVDFYNNWAVSNVPQGTLSSSSCVTSENGSCEITLTSNQSQTGSAEVVACVAFEELTRAYEESNGDLTFSWIEEAQPIFSSKSKGKNKKSLRSNNFTLKINEFKNSEAYQTQSEDRLVCTSGISGSHTVQYVTEEQFYINQVAEIDVWVIAGEVIEDNINVTVIDTIFARALNSNGQGIQNVPVQFNKTTNGFGYVSSSEAITDSTGLAMTIYYPNTESYSGSDDTVQISFTIGVAGNDAVADVNQQIILDTSGNINVELDVAYFDFYPNISNISHIMGNETSIEVIAKNGNGVGMANVPIRFSISSATSPCQGSTGCEDYSNETDCTTDTNGIGDCFWDVISPSGILSEFLVPTCCDDEGNADEGNIDEGNADEGNADEGSSTVTQPGVSRISYWNSEGLSDKLIAYIVHPLIADSILFQDEVTITTNITTGLITWAQMSTVSVASLDSLYCDSLYVTAIDANGNTLSDIPVTFNLDDAVNGSINIINPQTGSNGSPATALFCPIQGFIGYCNGSGTSCSDYETEESCIDVTNCEWQNDVNIEITTNVANVGNSTINITYIDATPECPECIAELKLEADDFILPSERSGTCSGVEESNTCSTNETENSCLAVTEPDYNCSWEGSGSTYITATLIDSLGYGPADNTHIFYKAIQQVPEPDNPDNLVWEPVGSIPEIDYFLNGTSEVLFDMENASGLIAIVGNAEALTDTIYLQLKSTTPSYIEIFDPYPSNIMVQGGGGQASTDINVAIRDANGSNVDKPFWVNFTIVGSPAGVHINGEPGIISVDQLTLNGESSISINAGTSPGTVRIKVELYEDNSGVMGSALSDVPTEEKNIVTVITGPPAQGIINYSYVDITAIDGGLYEVPVTVMLWDVHSNPVSDSTNVYFDVRGITNQYDPTMTYVNDEIIYWGSAPESRETPDSLVYRCYNPVHGVCQLSVADIISGVPNELVSNPPDGSVVLEHCVGEDPDGIIDCTDNLSSIACIAVIIDGTCEGENPICNNANESVCNAAGAGGADCGWVQNTCNWESLFDVDTAGELWIPQIHPASIEGAAKTGNENSNGEAYTGVANTVLRFGSSDIFAETVIRAHTLGVDGGSLIIDSRASHSGENLVLPLTADGNLSVSANPLAWDFSTVGDPDGNYDPNDPPIITVTATLSDYYQYFIDAGLLTISAPFGTVVSVCNGIDGDGDGITGTCTDDDGNSLPFSTCSTCGDEGGNWTADAGDVDVIGFGKTNSSGQVTWGVQYDFGINICDDCLTAQNPTCEDRESNIVVQLMDPLSQASDPVIVVLSQSVACE